MQHHTDPFDEILPEELLHRLIDLELTADQHQGGTATDPDGLRVTSAKLREEANILKLLLPNRAPGTREVV